MRQFIKYYFSNNLMEYVKLLVIFVIGIVVSIIVINKSSDTQQIEIRNFIDAKIETVKTSEYSDKSVVLVNSLKKNVTEFSIVVFLSSTLIGIPIVYYIILKRAFSIGYTISAVFATQSAKTAIIFICNSLVLHNIIYMMSIFMVLVSGINFVKIITKKGAGAVKFEIFRYIIFVLIALSLVIISSFFEAYISTNFLYLLKKYL